MQKRMGSRITDVRQHNRLLVLRHIATHPMISRADLAEATGLSKMAVGNMVDDLTELDLVGETRIFADGSSYGRPPGALYISEHSPLICGMLIKRSVLQVVLADLSGNLVDREEISYGRLIQKEELADRLTEVYIGLMEKQKRPVIAVGISSIGPVDSGRGIILNPPYFQGISNVEIVKDIRERTGLPVYLINDANAGALAEKLYGGAREEKNFAYLHIMNGIGLGCVLDNRLYNGNSGQSGEIGHTSINFMGPRCECGNVGCLELYANAENLCRRVQELAPILGCQVVPENGGALGWKVVVDSANGGNRTAVMALEEFCGYIAYALTNILNLLDFSHIIVGYDSSVKGDVVERLLKSKLKRRALSAAYRQIEIERSVFGGDAPLIGAIACVAERIFNMSLPVVS